MLIIHFIIRQEVSPEYFKYLSVGLVPLIGRLSVGGIKNHCMFARSRLSFGTGDVWHL